MDDRPGGRRSGSPSVSAAVILAAMDATVLTVGNEIVSGDTENTNASWLSRRLASSASHVTFVAAVRDEVEDDRRVHPRRSVRRPTSSFVTGGLGGTPDDVTREGVAAAFRVACIEIEPLAGELRARFGPRGLGDYAARWARLPAGAEPLANPLGGAPGFRVENVYVLPGLPSEMREMFDAIAERFRARRSSRGGGPCGRPRASSSRSSSARPRSIRPSRVGSYPQFGADGPEVEIVLKSRRRGGARCGEPGRSAADARQPARGGSRHLRRLARRRRSPAASGSARARRSRSRSRSPGAARRAARRSRGASAPSRAGRTRRG